MATGVEALTAAEVTLDLQRRTPLRAARAIGVAKLSLAFAIRIAPVCFLNSLPFHLGSFLLLLFYKIVKNCIAVICVDGQDLSRVTDDHKIQVRTAGR